VPLDDGYSTKVTFNANSDFSIWEKTVKPPGIDGLDAIDTTTMHNTEWRTYSPRSLKTLSTFTVTGAYDPDIYDDAAALLNENGVFTVEFPDGATIAFYGAITNLDFAEMSEGTHPEVTITVTPTNQDDNGVEQSPVMAGDISGTGGTLY